MAKSRFPVWLMTVLQVLVTMALYWPTMGHDFVILDDSQNVLYDTHVTSGLNLENARWALTTLHVGLWRPLTWLSHMLDCQWFELRPGWHHLAFKPKPGYIYAQNNLRTALDLTASAASQHHDPRGP
jgi:hypothetical protein